MKKLLILMFMVSYCFSFAITKEQIMKSGDYYYGESTAPVYQQARDRAIRELSEKIIVQVSIETINIEGKLNLTEELFSFLAAGRMI